MNDRKERKERMSFTYTHTFTNGYYMFASLIFIYFRFFDVLSASFFLCCEKKADVKEVEREGERERLSIHSS